MAAPTYSKAFDTKAIIVPEATYGTLAGSGQSALRLISETLTAEKPPLYAQIKDANGAARKRSIFDTETASGTLIVEADYSNIVTLLEACLGSQTGTGAVSTPYVTVPSDEMSSSYSIVIEKGLKRHQFLGGMVQAMRLKGDVAMSRLRLETDWIFSKRTVSADPILSASLTSCNAIEMSELVFRIGDISDALGAADALPISTFELGINNNLKVDYASSSTTILQPIRDRQREVYLNITAPRYSSVDEIAAIVTAQEAFSQMQADFTFTGASPKELYIEIAEMFPSAQFQASTPEDFSVRPFDASWDCFDNVNNKTYMSDTTNELYTTLKLTA